MFYSHSVTQVIRWFSSNTEISLNSSLALLIWHSQQLTPVPWDRASQRVTDTPPPAPKLLLPRALEVVCLSLDVTEVGAQHPGSVVNLQHDLPTGWFSSLYCPRLSHLRPPCPFRWWVCLWARSCSRTGEYAHCTVLLYQPSSLSGPAAGGATGSENSWHPFLSYLWIYLHLVIHLWT